MVMLRSYCYDGVLTVIASGSRVSGFTFTRVRVISVCTSSAIQTRVRQALVDI